MHLAAGSTANMWNDDKQQPPPMATAVAVPMTTVPMAMAVPMAAPMNIATPAPVQASYASPGGVAPSMPSHAMPSHAQPQPRHRGNNGPMDVFKNMSVGAKMGSCAILLLTLGAGGFFFVRMVIQDCGCPEENYDDGSFFRRLESFGRRLQGGSSHGSDDCFCEGDVFSCSWQCADLCYEGGEVVSCDGEECLEPPCEGGTTPVTCFAGDGDCSNGEAACEGHDYTEDQCNAVGCCSYEPDSGESNKCWSNVGSGTCTSDSSDSSYSSYSSGNYTVLGGSYTFYEARDACLDQGMRLASFSTPAESDAAQDAVGAAGEGAPWIAAWRDMGAETWGWYGYPSASGVRAEWHVFAGPSGCYMAASEDCDPESYPYATDCYACENIDVEATRHGFKFDSDGDLNMDPVDEGNPALCQPF